MVQFKWGEATWRDKAVEEEDGLQFGMQALQVGAVLGAEAFVVRQQCCCAWALVSGEKWLRFGFLKPLAAVPASRGCLQHMWGLGTGQVSFATMQGEVAFVFSCLRSS